jgi:RimJ/RimL family protein N-acetyltransferase
MRGRMKMIADPLAAKIARELPLRGDMAEQFAQAGATIPPGPKWAVEAGGRVIGLGGLSPQGAAASVGWLLVADGLTVRDWAVGRWALRTVMEWAASHSIRRVRALVDAGNPGAQRLLARLGFEATGRDGDEITMTRELTR